MSPNALEAAVVAKLPLRVLRVLLVEVRFEKGVEVELVPTFLNELVTLRAVGGDVPCEANDVRNARFLLMCPQRRADQHRAQKA